MAINEQARKNHYELCPGHVSAVSGSKSLIEGSAAGRAGTPDEVGAVGALLMGREGGFITGSDFLMDGGVTAAYWYGDLAEVRAQQ